MAILSVDAAFMKSPSASESAQSLMFAVSEELSARSIMRLLKFSGASSELNPVPVSKMPSYATAQNYVN